MRVRFACIDPITNSGKLASVCYFESSKFVSQTVVQSISDIQADKFLCYDAQKLFTLFSNCYFFEDIKILYGLYGYVHENFISLSKAVLGDDESAKYVSISDKITAHIRSYNVANIKIGNYSLVEVLPKDTVYALYKERSKLLVELYFKILQEKELFDFYKVFYSTLETLSSLSKQPIFVDLDVIKGDTSPFAETIRKNTIDGQAFLKFNAVGAKTGRLTTHKGSISVYTLPKNLRRCLVPPKHFNFVQADYKSFQPRLAIFSTENNAFRDKFINVDDIYSIFRGDREENKISFITWMFSNRKNDIFDVEAEPILSFRDNLYHNAIRKGYSINKFGRPLFYKNEEKNVLFQNYITSNEVDAILSLLGKINEIFKGKQSRIAFPFHDALVFYIHEEEMNLLKDIKQCMEQHLCDIFSSKFPVSISKGDNFLELEAWKE